MWHPDEGTIHAWLDGALDPAEATRVETHVASCAECAPVVAEARELIGGSSRVIASLDYAPGGVAMRPVAVGAPPRARGGSGSGSVWRKLHLSPALAAAAAVIIVGAGTFFTLSQRGTESKPTVVAAVSDSATTALDSVRRAYEEARRRAEEMAQGSARSSEPAARASAGMVAAAPLPAAPAREPSVANEATSKAAMAEMARSDAAPAARAAKARTSAGAAPSAMAFGTADAARAAGCYVVSPADRARFTSLPGRFTLDTALVQLGPKSSGEAHHAVRTEPEIAGSYWDLSGTRIDVVFGAAKTGLSFAVPDDAKSEVHATVTGGGALSLGRC